MRNWISSFRFSLAVQVVILTIATLSVGQTQAEHNQSVARFGMSWEILRSGRIWHLLSGTWIQSSPGLGWNMVSMCLMVALGTFPLEHRMGSLRTAITVILADWFATIGVVVTLRLMDAAGHLSDPTLLTTPDSGTSALAWGGMAAGAMVAFPRYRRSLLALLAVAMAIQFMVETTIPAVAHGYAVLFGLGAGALYLRRSAASA